MSEKKIEEVDAIMSTIPEQSRLRWCGGENGVCACMGCVQVCNRVVMWEKATGRKFTGDPEYIQESRIPLEIYDAHKISRADWEAWKTRNAS